MKMLPPTGARFGATSRKEKLEASAGRFRLGDGLRREADVATGSATGEDMKGILGSGGEDAIIPVLICVFGVLAEGRLRSG